MIFLEAWNCKVWHATFLHESANVVLKFGTTKQCRSKVIEHFFFYSKDNLHHTKTSELCLCPFVPIACYNWHSIQIKTLFTAKEDYLAVLVLFSPSGMSDDWAMRRGWLITRGALKKNRQLTSSFRDERRVNVTISIPLQQMTWVKKQIVSA